MPFNNIIIIGDTVYDIECARHSGSVSVAVGTGWTGRDVLVSHNPDFYFDDLAETDLVIKSILD
jgi:phosphoglycolate phosphatase